MNDRRLPLLNLMMLSVCLGVLSPSTTEAQAWLPEQGQMTISLLSAYSDVKYHYGNDHVPEARGSVYYYTANAGIEYGIMNSLALNVSIPVSISRYVGKFPHRFAGKPVDDNVYRGGFQDFAFMIRWMSLMRPLVVTPFLSVIIPSHKYKTLGHTAVGRDVRELHLGIYLGKLAMGISDNLYTELGYDFAFVEMIDDISANRSRAEFTLGYFVTPIVSLSTSIVYAKTHGGVIPTAIDQIHDPEDFHEHDRHAADEYINIGGSASVSVSDPLNLYVMFGAMVWGKNIMAPRTLAFGLNWSFQTSY
jgi:hypothetical protein